MAKDAIRKTIRDLGNALGFRSLRLEDENVVIDAGEFISFALRYNVGNGNGNGKGEEEGEEEEEGPKKPPRKVNTDLIRSVLASLGGKATSTEIRDKLKEDHKISASAADIRPILQALVEEGEISTSGQARALTYNAARRKK